MRRRLKKGAVPSVFAWNGNVARISFAEERAKRCESREARPLPSRKIAANVDLYVVVGKYPSKIGMCVKTQLCFCSKSKAEHSSTQFWMCIMHERNHSHPLICA